MAVRSNTSRTKTFEDYKAERRRVPPSGDPLADYVPQSSGSTAAQSRGIPQDRPLCTCGAEVCPDKRLA